MKELVVQFENNSAKPSYVGQVKAAYPDFAVDDRVLKELQEHLKVYLSQSKV